MKKVLYIITSLLIASFVLPSCEMAEPGITETSVSSTDQAYFSRFMVIGDDFAAGYQNMALTKKYQEFSFPAIIAGQAQAVTFDDEWLENGATDFIQPYMTYPGLGPISQFGYGVLEMENVDNPATPNTVNPDPLIKAADNEDYPNFDILNPYYSDEIRDILLPYSNLSIPGIVLNDVLNAKTILRSSSRSQMINYILRNESNPYGEMSPFRQGSFFVPTMMLVWAGINDALNSAQLIEYNQVAKLSAPTDAAIFDEQFRLLADSLEALQETYGTYIAVANIPDITEMPYFNSVPLVVIDTTTNAPYLDNSGNTVALVGPEEGDQVIRPAIADMRNGIGLPVGVLNGTGEALDEDKILDASEIAAIKSAIASYNTSIDSIATNRGFPVVDMYSLFGQLKDGLEIAGEEFTNEFVFGGFYSYDGIHPSVDGNVIIANEWIDVINSEFPVSIPRASLTEVRDDFNN